MQLCSCRKVSLELCWAHNSKINSPPQKKLFLVQRILISCGTHLLGQLWQKPGVLASPAGSTYLPDLLLPLYYSSPQSVYIFFKKLPFFLSLRALSLFLSLICVRVCVHKGAWRGQKMTVDSPGTEVGCRGLCPTIVGAGNQTLILLKNSTCS